VIYLNNLVRESHVRKRWKHHAGLKGLSVHTVGIRLIAGFFDGHRLYWQCSGCRKQTYVQALFLISPSKNNISALELKRQIRVSYRSAWGVKHKIMQVMLEREDSRILSGDIVIDDAYLGGENKGKAGRGSENKVPFVAAIQLNDLG
jgi:hypothetical protein